MSIAMRPTKTIWGPHAYLCRVEDSDTYKELLLNVFECDSINDGDYESDMYTAYWSYGADLLARLTDPEQVFEIRLAEFLADHEELSEDDRASVADFVAEFIASAEDWKPFLTEYGSLSVAVDY